MTTDADRQRLADLRCQAAEFAEHGGFGEAHNRAPGVAAGDRRQRNKRRRQRVRARLRAVLA